MSATGHVMGQPWTREQIEEVAGGRADPQEIYAALMDRIRQRYRRTTDIGRRARVRWLIQIEAAVAMRDTARPEHRAEWDGLVQRLMRGAPAPVESEPDYSAWMPQRAA